MPGKKVVICLCLILLLTGQFCFPLSANSQTLDVSSGALDTINKQLADLNQALNDSIAATKPLQSQLQSMQNQITGIQQQVAGVQADIATKKQQIAEGYKDLAQKETILNQTIRDYYVNTYNDSPLLVFFSTATASDVTQTLAYQRAQTQQDKSIITNIALTVNNLQTEQTQLEQEQNWLSATQATLDQQSAKLNTIIQGALAYQQNVSAQIQALSAQQQAIINARSGSFTATIGDSDEADDPNASLDGFRANAPAGSFAVFSFGAYTHRKGMSQYGAFGRANAGQDYHAILKAYYGQDVSTTDTSGTINVDGAGAIDFETNYLYGIAEMPADFPMEALKAQAVAARTYAYRYKQSGQSICTDESCQVYDPSKAANPPAAWKEAVDSTKGQVINGVVTYFSSTAGGYLTTSGWDTTDGNGGSDFADRAFEKLAGSPWFYKAWYTQGYSVDSDKCGRDNPWLTSDDMADLINATLVLANGSSDETSRITPITTSCWPGNPYSHDDLRQIASKYGGGVSSVSSVSTQQGNNGQTSQVIFQTDKGTITLSGSSFKTAFDLRAPGYLSIPQDGFAFFNIEQK